MRLARVKICGITSLGDALAASEYGADAIGFVFYKGSPRYIEPQKAGAIIAKLPPFIVPVGVFVNEGINSIRSIVRRSMVSLIQLHGDESPEFCEEARKIRAVIKALRVKGDGKEVLKEIRRYRTGAILLDSYSDAMRGGTGKGFDLKVAERAGRTARIILSGGLSPENVKDAIKKTRPYAVDVSSGVESAPGRKDHLKIKRFIQAAEALQAG